MKPIRVLAGFVCLLFLATATVRADDEEDAVPSFKSSTKKDTKEFVTKVGTAILKAARSKPAKVELDTYEYTSPKEGRRELKIKLNWQGSVTKVKFTSDIVVKIDASDKEKWEVLNIDYEDSNKNPLAKPNTKKIQDLIPKFNK